MSLRLLLVIIKDWNYVNWYSGHGWKQYVQENMFSLREKKCKDMETLKSAQKWKYLKFIPYVHLSVVWE